MSSFNLAFIFFIVFFTSCSPSRSALDVNKSEDKTLVGYISATEYNIPVPCNIEVYYDNKLVYNTISNDSGEFTLLLNPKYLEKNILIVTKLLKDGVSMRVTGNVPQEGGIASVNCKTNLNINKRCEKDSVLIFWTDSTELSLVYTKGYSMFMFDEPIIDHK
jgi:hypothetical protein